MRTIVTGESPFASAVLTAGVRSYIFFYELIEPTLGEALNIAVDVRPSISPGLLHINPSLHPVHEDDF